MDKTFSSVEDFLVDREDGDQGLGFLSLMLLTVYVTKLLSSNNLNPKIDLFSSILNLITDAVCTRKIFFS